MNGRWQKDWFKVTYDATIIKCIKERKATVTQNRELYHSIGNTCNCFCCLFLSYGLRHEQMHLREFPYKLDKQDVLKFLT